MGRGPDMSAAISARALSCASVKRKGRILFTTWRIGDVRGQGTPRRDFFSRRARQKAIWRRNSSSKARDRKSTRLNSSHLVISYAVFCLKKKKQKECNDEIRLICEYNSTPVTY